MRFVALDPPYKGQSKKHYGNHPDYAGEVDHVDLMRWADREFDGWALHLSAPSLKSVLNDLDDAGVDESTYRIMPWVKPFAAFKPNVPVAYAWEPVIIKPVRTPVVTGRMVMRDWCSENITMRRGISGAKPERLCHWVFEVAGLVPTDEFVDQFPGSGAVLDAWNSWCKMVESGSPSIDESRIGRLPKWAQETISSLQAEVDYLRGSV